MVSHEPRSVLSASIDKYCYILCRWLPPFFEHKHRIVWSQIESPQTVEEIRHPAVRETLKFLKITRGVEIHHAGDLPAMTGMGTSSAFTVALLLALHTLEQKRTYAGRYELARDAIHIERDLLEEAVGSQDQMTSAIGGFNRIDFSVFRDQEIMKVTPLNPQRIEGYLMLFFTGFSRKAAQIAQEQVARIGENDLLLQDMYALVGEAQDILEHCPIADLGKLLDQTWRYKKQLAPSVSTQYIDYLYQKAIDAGALGGKLLGAGGGGFLLLFVEPEKQESVRNALQLLQVPFKFEYEGASVIFGG